MDKKSIGIITIHKSPVSYGACLQTYALYKYMSTLDFQCEIIDLYRPIFENYIHNYSLLSFSTCEKEKNRNKLKSCIKRILFYFIKPNKVDGDRNYLKQQRFDSFNSLIKYSKPYKSIEDLYENPPLYDFYMTGSDQVWNPDMPFENEPYLLGFAPNEKRLVSYASSFGRDNLPEEYKMHYAKFLKRYSLISVREESGKSIVEELIDEKVFVALDPTMLLDKSNWQDIAVRPDIKEKYLFCYSLHNNEEVIKYALNICKKRDFVLVIISDDKIVKEDDVQIINKYDSGPKEWLGLIGSAELIVTDSFHGTVFSILFQKQFLSYVKEVKPEKSLGTRIDNLLNKLSLEEYLIKDLSCDNNGQHNEDINYASVDSKLNKLIDASKEYLKRALS
jgi:hypothetical protein